MGSALFTIVLSTTYPIVPSTMRQFFKLSVLSLLLLQSVPFGASAVEIPIVTLDGGHQHNGRSPALSENSARLLLQRRIERAADSAFLGTFDDETIEYLNEFGGKKQSSLFGNSEKTKMSLNKGLVVLEGLNGQACRWSVLF